MDDATITKIAGRDTVSDPISELLRKGTQQLLQRAVETELEPFFAIFADLRAPQWPRRSGGQWPSS